MKASHFEGVLDAQFKRIRDVLVVKAAEYATEDRLANFKKAAVLRGCTVPQAISGMMVKHTVSVFDMVEGGKEFPIEVWDEKITDHLNYLILLRASLVDTEQAELDGFHNTTAGD